MAKGVRPNWRAVSVSFITDTQAVEPQFSVPQEICDLLGVKCGDDLTLTVEGDGIQIDSEIKQLISGAEIRDSRLKPGTKINVRASI